MSVLNEGGLTKTPIPAQKVEETRRHIDEWVWCDGSFDRVLREEQSE